MYVVRMRILSIYKITLVHGKFVTCRFVTVPRVFKWTIILGKECCCAQQIKCYFEAWVYPVEIDETCMLLCIEKTTLCIILANVTHFYRLYDFL